MFGFSVINNQIFPGSEGVKFDLANRKYIQPDIYFEKERVNSVGSITIGPRNFAKVHIF